MHRFIVLVLILLSSAGCSTVPFQRTNYASLDSVEPQLARKEFAVSLPDEFQIINSVVFHYKWRNYSALGFIDVNRELKTFSVSCLNPIGIKLFELTGDENSITTNYVLKELLSKGDLPQVVGEDIRRIYFDNVPSGVARAQKEKRKIVFSEPRGQGVIRYVFAGAPTMLVEKKYYEKKRLVWSVSFYEYRQEHGKYYPSGIVLKNSRFNYSLTVHLKEVR